MRPFGIALALASLALSSCTTNARPTPITALPAGAHYVAMGSSFAAGPGILPQVDTPDIRCGRSDNNYARHIARALNLLLTDVSCGGAKTDHLLGPWNELPAQLDALTPETQLVTITIGGNDVGFVGTLVRLSCATAFDGDAAEPVKILCEQMRAYAENAAAQGTPLILTPATEEDWTKLERNFQTLNAEIRSRAPEARIIYVDYVTMVPEGALCMAVPLTDQQAEEARGIADRLAEITHRTALADGAEVVTASALSRAHHPCTDTPWSVGLLPPADAPQSAPYHPNAAGMRGITNAVLEVLSH